MKTVRAETPAGRRFCGGARRGRLAGTPFFLVVALSQGAAAFGAVAETAQAVPAPVHATRAPRRVLVLYSDNRLLPANLQFDASLREALRPHDGEPIDYCSEFLDEVRFPAHHQERMFDLLRAKYGENPPDVIVAFALPALDFCFRHRSQLFPQVPVVFARIGADVPPEPELGPRVTGVQSNFDGPATLHLALRLHPRTQQVFVVDGSARVDSAALTVRWSTLQQSEFRTTFHHLTGQPMPQLLEELARVPENSLVIDLSVFGSRAWSDVAAQEKAERMARVSRAPIYAAFDPLVGFGVVGAVTTPMDAIGRKTADLVAQVLERRDAGDLPAVQTLAATPLFDWRQLRRWGLLQNVSLALELSPGALLVHGDEVQLQQVLLNLVMNALDAIKESGGNRRLVLRTAASDDRSVQVTVEDSGVGVPADRLEQVFEPFVTTKPLGLGLGLAICRSIIQAHGGRIGCTNNTGRGATFWFRLPAVEKVEV